MKIDFSQAITDLDGNVVKENSEAMSLWSVCVNVLLTPLEGDKLLEGKDKVEHLKLAERIYKQNEVEVAVEELSLLKKRICKLYSTLPAGRAMALLEREI